MPTPSEQLREHVRAVLRDADDPLPAGRIQRRISNNGFDATTSAVRDVCAALIDEGRVEASGTPPAYRLVE